ncbi:MAG: META domain-containing protein [Acidimicrobiia bacterium]
MDNGVANGDKQFGIRNAGWLLVSGSVDEQPIPTEPDLVMRFGETILSFPLSCNSGSVPYEVDGTSIEFDLDHFATSLEACSTDQADMFEASLPRVETVTMSDDEQHLEFEGDGVSMQFVSSTASSGPLRYMLGRLVCSPGVVVEERVPDTGQDQLEVARAAARDVVEVESDSPLWWWGLDQNGTVIVALALGDADGADYQVWTCEP